MNLPHEFTARASGLPTGNIPLSVDGLPPLESEPPVAFGGSGTLWSPEDFLVAAVADCFVLSFRAIAAASKLEWNDLECSVTGTLDKVERAIQFTQLEITAKLQVPEGTDPARAQRLLEKSENACFISNSLKSEVHLKTEIIHNNAP